ncbi:hypothetical protein NCCP436_14600 [Pseudomonas sp. NCCP-436]|nr:hypothetical protein NCCP436_14600 [Pseudomonas sp. NCCP-436]
MLLAYAKQAIESSKLEKARQRADLQDRLRRSQEISERLPGQLMTAKLKLLLSRLQLQLTERLLTLDKHNDSLRQDVQALQALVAQGESIVVNNQPSPIGDENKAKEVRFLLESLHTLISTAGRNDLLPLNEAKLWTRQIRHMAVLVHIELFSTLGRRALQQEQPAQARLAFERAIQFLRKQPDQSPYQAHLSRFEQQLQKASAMLLNQTSQATQNSELNEGLKSLEDEGDWKKKNIYD